MNWADIIQAIGIAISAVILACVGWQQAQVRSLRKRIETLEVENETQKGLFRESVRFIRTLLRFIDGPPGKRPEIPLSLEDLI